MDNCECVMSETIGRFHQHPPTTCHWPRSVFINHRVRVQWSWLCIRLLRSVAGYSIRQVWKYAQRDWNSTIRLWLEWLYVRPCANKFISFLYRFLVADTVLYHLYHFRYVIIFVVCQLHSACCVKSKFWWGCCRLWRVFLRGCCCTEGYCHVVQESFQDLLSKQLLRSVLQ